jgi:hypothetical protein
MANRDRLYGNDTGFVTLFARAPQLCAAALAGLASALWLNVVGPFAGLVAAWGALILVSTLAIAVVAILAILVTTAGTLLAADWRAEVAARQAWAEIEVAGTELHLTLGTAALSQIDPRYLTATTGEALPSVFCTHHPASLAPVVERGSEASCATRIVVAARRPIPPIATSEAAPRIARKISSAQASEFAVAHSPHRKAARTSLGREFLLVASGQARPRAFRAGTAAVTTRLVANAAWSERLAYHRCVLTRAPPDRHVADVVVLSGDRRDRDPPNLPGASTGNGTVKIDEPPSCRGPPTTDRQRTRPTETLTAERLAKDSSKVPVAPRPADHIVCDDFGRPVAVCAAELDVIETYLDHVLREMLGIPGRGRDNQAS